MASGSGLVTVHLQTHLPFWAEVAKVRGGGAEGIPVAWSNQAAGGAWGEVAALDGFLKISYQIAPVPLHCFYRYCFLKGRRAAL